MGRIRVAALVVGASLSLALVLILTVVVVRSQARARDDALDRFADRGLVAAQLLAGENDRAEVRQSADAQIRLSGPATPEALDRWEGATDPTIPYTALYDRRGRLLAVYPTTAEPATTPSGMAALDDALRGRPGTSGIVEGPEGPLIETFVPFPAGDEGLRVLLVSIPTDFFGQLATGALEGVAGTPGGNAYLMDRDGAVVAAVGPGADLPSAESAVSEAVRSGRAAGPLGERWLVVHRIPRMGLVVALTALQDELTADLPSTLAPRLTLAALAAALLAAFWLAVRTVRDARRLEAARLTAEDARRQATDANLAKSEFLARMSHELRTPLNAVLGFGQLLELEDLSPDERESTTQILKGGRHLLELINEVLDISRIESGVQRLSLEPVAVGPAVDEAVALIRPLADERGISLRPETAPDVAERYVMADKQRLGQVLLNLLSNAVKYNVDGGTVAISTTTGEAGEIRIGVADTGPGIPQELVPKLFTPFERLGAEQTPVEGTGLGLVLSKTLVEAMGGSLVLENASGRGATFWVDLRETDAPSRDVAAETGRVPHTAGRGGTILYVEDNLSNLTLIERLLSRWSDVVVISAMTGALGVELARQHLPDLILLDLHLPDLQGEEVLARLRKDPRTAHIPVVVVSADASRGRLDRLKASGAEECLTKPIDVPEFIELVGRLLGPRGDTALGR